MIRFGGDILLFRYRRGRSLRHCSQRRWHMLVSDWQLLKNITLTLRLQTSQSEKANVSSRSCMESEQLNY